MLEYHGWINIRETAGLDDDEALLRRQVAEIGEVVAALDAPGLLDLRWVNGEAFLTMAASTNHRGPREEQVLGLMALVGEIAPGSYGLLHVRDDEDRAYGNEFRVHRLVRGRVTEHADTLLSPAIPTLEDPWDPAAE